MLAVYNRKHSLHSIPHAYHARLSRQRARSVLLAAIVVVLHAGFTPNASGQVIRERVEISPHPTTKTATTSSSLALLRQDGPVTVINTLPGVRVSVTGTSFQAGGTIPPHASVEIFIWMGGADYTVLTVWADGRGEVFQVKPPVPPRDLLYCGAQVYVTYCLRWWGVFSCTYRYKLASASVSGSTATFTIQDFLSDGWYVNVPFTATVTVGAEPLPGYELAQVIVAPGKTSLRCVDQTTVAMTLKNDLGQNLSICSGAMTTTVSLTGVGPYAFLRRGTQEGQTLSIPMTSATASFEVVVDTARGVIPLGSQQARLRVEVGGVTKDTLMTVSCFYPPPTVRIVRPAHDTTMVLTETHQPVLTLEEIHTPGSGKFEPTISWEPSQMINTAEYFDQIQDSLVITAKVTARNIADMIATDSVRIVLKKNVLDHFAVRVEKDTVAQTDTATIYVQAKDAQDRDIDLADNTLIGFSIEEGSSLGMLTATSATYGQARSGAVHFVAHGVMPSMSLGRSAVINMSMVQTDDPVLIIGKALIRVFLVSDSTKSGRGHVVVLKKVKVKLVVGSSQLRPLGDTDNKKVIVGRDTLTVIDFGRVKTTTVTVTVTDVQGNAIANYPFTLRALVRTNSGGHDHHDVGRPTGRFVTGADTTVTVQDRTDAAGERQYRYLSSGLGGVDSLVVRGMTARDTASATIVLKIADFEELTEGSNYRLIGAYGEPGVNSQHRKNHFGTTNLVSRLKALADSVHADSSYVLRFNDMSLQFGGPFDTRNNWNAPHQTHREGVSVDIDDVDGRGRTITVKYLQEKIENPPFKGKFLNEKNHYHITFR